MGASDSSSASRGHVLQSVQRACRALILLAEAGRPMSPKDIADGLDMNVTTSYHLLNTLEGEGFIVRDADRRLRLGHRIGELATSFQDMFAPDPTMIEYLEELNSSTGETAYLGVWRDDQVVSVAVREGRGGVRVRGLYLGYSAHTYARALGRALLAYRDEEFIDDYLASTRLEALTAHTTVDRSSLKLILAEIRKTGLAVELEEFTAGVCCVAAPIFGGQGEPVGALSVSVPSSRYADEGTAIRDQVRTTAAAASGTFAARSRRIRPA